MPMAMAALHQGGLR